MLANIFIFSSPTKGNTQQSKSATYKMSLYKINCKSSGKSVSVESLYMQKTRAIKMSMVITSEIQKRANKLSTEDRMEMYALKDELIAWVVDFQQQGVSSRDLAPVFKRIREMLLIWGEDGL